MIDAKKLIENHPLFSTFSPQLQEQLSHCDVLDFSPGTKFSPQKMGPDENYYLVLEGTIVVVSVAADESYPLDTLRKGAIFGSLYIKKSFFFIKEKTTLLVISKTFLQKALNAKTPEIFNLMEKLHAQTLAYFERLSDLNISLIRQKKHMGIFLINLTVFLSVFIIMVPYLAKWTHDRDSIFIATPLIIAGGLFLLVHLAIVKEPFSTVGIHTKNLKRGLILAIWFSLIAVVVLIGVKFLAIHFTSRFEGQKLFSLWGDGKRPFWQLGLVIVVYAIHSFFQELVFRGGIQGLFRQFLTSKKRDLQAIVLASIVFACSHAFFGLQAVFIVFILSLLWCYLYSKVGNIFAPALSHIIIGVIILFFIASI